MLNRLPVEDHRAEIVESAIAIAERSGIDAVTMQAVATESGVQEQTVRNMFESDDSLVTAMSEALARQLTTSMLQTFFEAAESAELTGIRGLRVLLHSALSGFWPMVEEAPDRRLLVFELTAYGLRHPDSGVASAQYRSLDEYGTVFLNECAKRTGTTWLEPVGAVARLSLALLDGLVLRWLVDRRSEAMLAQLDDVAAIIASKATE
ncbi:TetR/AcrR family transcriptional regulator [Antrihabitans cavernicola]|uniref:TetR/AcrR family transcriptional regulator n=1 Tax=Antrihabitans cavernicola TaxID=2495913 RepID=A0A5A7SE68_9NOCA|nr:TetR family transcriptional regulator [Spelaeibacter cavernicola]KAA0022521.1 TetR/AcrR family transcriptional regulator [Spelaeibacter cavernicola]